MFSDKHKTHKYSVGHSVQLLNVKLVVHHVTGRPYKFKLIIGTSRRKLETVTKFISDVCDFLFHPFAFIYLCLFSKFYPYSFCASFLPLFLIFLPPSLSLVDRCSTVVKVLRYKLEGRWFDPRGCHWNFSLT